jgi:WD repeat-containing protein 7
MYLHDDDLVNRALAIDLCARGFDIWQNHADAMDLLRALFSMAAIPNKKDMTAHNVGTQARSAVVLIATHNGPLFTTTLSMEISQPQSVEDRRSAMQILAFLVRKVS